MDFTNLKKLIGVMTILEINLSPSEQNIRSLPLLPSIAWEMRALMSSHGSSFDLADATNIILSTFLLISSP